VYYTNKYQQWLVLISLLLFGGGLLWWLVPIWIREVEVCLVTFPALDLKPNTKANPGGPNIHVEKHKS